MTTRCRRPPRHAHQGLASPVAERAVESNPWFLCPLQLRITRGSCACCKLSVRVASSNHLYDQLLTCAGPDAFLLEALFRNETWGFMLHPVSHANEDAICQSMVDGCRHASN